MRRYLARTVWIAVAFVSAACVANAPIVSDSVEAAGAAGHGVGGSSSSGGLAGGGGGGGLGAGGIAPGCDLTLAQQTVQARGMTITATVQTYEFTLPSQLTDPDWSVKAQACQEGGYNLSGFAGGNLCGVYQWVTRLCGGQPTGAWVLMRDGTVACVYVTFQPGYGAPPGVLSVTDPTCAD
jgi:hypothetical protein